MSGGCGDHDAVGCVEEPGVDDGDLPAGHFAGVVAAFAGAAAVGVTGGSAFALTDDVINMSNGRTTEGTPASLLIAEPDELSKPALETALMLIRPHDRTGLSFHI